MAREPLKRRGAVFFDRDGVLNEDSGYVHRIEDFRWLPGAKAALRLVNQAGLLAIVVTNQSGVARGLYDESVIVRLHRWVVDDLARSDARIDAFYYCPYHEDGVVPAYVVANHSDRKPNPGMILRAIADFGIEPSAAFIIGDKASDVEAGRRAGIDGFVTRGGQLDALVRSLLSEAPAEGKPLCF